MASIDKAAIVFSIAIALVGVGIAVGGSAADNSLSDAPRDTRIVAPDTKSEPQSDPFAGIAEKVKSEKGMMENESIEPKDKVTTDTMDDTMMDGTGMGKTVEGSMMDDTMMDDTMMDDTMMDDTMMDDTMMDDTMMDDTMMDGTVEPATYIVDMPIGTAFPGCEEDNTCYIPANITINAGDTVEWTNSDTAAHTVTGGSPADGPSGVFDSSLILVEKSFAFTFNDAGSYDYFCIVHPWMIGSVTVN